MHQQNRVDAPDVARAQVSECVTTPPAGGPVNGSGTRATDMDGWNSTSSRAMPAPLAARVRDTLRELMLLMRRLYFIRVWKMDIGEGAAISLSAKLDKTNPRGVHIGKYTVVTFGAAVVTHDYVNRRDRDVHIGDNCFIGAHSIILPGVTIGDNCIVSAASVVARNVPAGSLVAGNPARIVESNVKTTRYGVRIPRES